MLSSIIIGGGPGGLGPLIWAAQHGRLSEWLERGVVVVERQDHLGGTLGRCGIPSDSLGGSYLECLEASRIPSPMVAMRQDPIAQEMETYRHTYPQLQFVDRYMRRLGLAISQCLGESSLRLSTEARAIRLRPDGSVTVETVGPNGHETLVARTAVIALGGRQHWENSVLCPGLTLGDCNIQNLMLSDDALSAKGLEKANRLMAEAGEREILILGGAHSAYSVAGALLGLPAAEKLTTEQMVIVQRRIPHIFYHSRDAARADSYHFEEGDICPRTQRVNRMSGIRGFGRDVWRRIAGCRNTIPEPRVAAKLMRQFSVDQLREKIERAAVVIPCFGYRSKTLPVFDVSGERLVLNADMGGANVGKDSHLLLSDGVELPNIFGIGLGTGYKLASHMGGEPNFNGQANSLWLYHNDIGAVMYRSIHEYEGVALGAINSRTDAQLAKYAREAMVAY